MTENDSNPVGGFALNALLQQAQQMQQQMVSAQEELADATVTGTVGDGLVTVTL
ncbi:MAG: YbaB/EbfC family nucleoid-associated protein, partial [Nocardioidaceae bacterium]